METGLDDLRLRFVLMTPCHRPGDRLAFEQHEQDFAIRESRTIFIE